MTSTSLKVTVAGIRGKIDDSMLPATALQFAEIFGTVSGGGKIILGTDTRVSTGVMKSAILAGLLATGCQVIDIGIVATPTAQLMVRHLAANGGIMITASHNPIMWNGLKFISPKGIFFDEEEMQKIFDLYAKTNQLKKSADTNEQVAEAGLISYQDHAHLGSVEVFEDAVSVHINHILKHVNVDAIKKANLSVVVDCGNGSGAVTNPVLFDRLGITVHYLGAEPTGWFTRGPEPLPKNITELMDAVKFRRADIGFAQDADADRLAIVNEKGQAIGEDYTLVLTMKYILDQHKNLDGKIVATNLSTTKAFDDVAAQYGVQSIRTKIGEVNVSKVLMQDNAVVGGEGNGGVIIPSIGFGRDSLAGMAFILEALATSGKTVSELAAEVPRYEVVKKSKAVSTHDEVNAILDLVRKQYHDANLDETDGIKVQFEQSWLHVRASNTEPIIRYFAEAPTSQEAQQLVDSVFEF